MKHPLKRYLLTFLSAGAVLNGVMGVSALTRTLTHPDTLPPIAQVLGGLTLFWGMVIFFLSLIPLFLWQPRWGKFLPQTGGITAAPMVILVIFGLITLLIVQSLRSVGDPHLTESLAPARFMIPVWFILGLIAACIASPRLIPRLMLAGFSLTLTFFLIETSLRFVFATEGLTYIPAYVPDEAIGWKLAPQLEFEWAGLDPACVEFRNTVQANSLGFFDREHTPEKKSGVYRVALFGDSYVMAREVPLAQHASQLLENMLNDNPPFEAEFEVLNFGVTGFSVGQYLSTYEAYAADFSPDVVMVLISEIQLERTVLRENSLGLGGSTDKTGYNLRPTFGLSDDGTVLERTDPQDVAELQAQLDALKDENGQFTPQPVTRIPEAYPEATLLGSPYAWLITHSQLVSYTHRRLNGIYESVYQTITGEHYWVELPLVDIQNRYNLPLNYKILAELSQQIEGQLVVVDNSRYTALQTDLERESQVQGWGYINLTAALQQTESAGERTTFPCDGHFNAAGNRVFAESLLSWFGQP